MSSSIPRIKNYFIARQRQEDECQWLRVEEVGKLDLPRPLVLLSGEFDLLNSGLMRLIFSAREKAKSLICALDPTTPSTLHSWVERATLLGYTPVDYIVELETPKDLSRLIRILRPDLWALESPEETRYPSIPRMYVRPGGVSKHELIRRIHGRID